VSFRVQRLSNPTEWKELEDLLKKNQSRPGIADNILRHLQLCGAASVLIEEDYIDRDFSEAYSAYYSKTFRRHTKLCKRLVFFASDVSFIKTETDVLDTAHRLQSQPCLGHIVLRPISKAPIGNATLTIPPPPAGYEGELLVKSNYVAHALGAELAVSGVPMTQQDSRVGACAQAAIWSAARHLHAKHRGAWMSIVSITAAATKLTQSVTNLQLPAGSEGLTVDNMVAALRSADREPLIYAKQRDPSQGGALTWGQLRPVDIIDRYVDSGIPVILSLEFPGASVGHAVLATGRVTGSTPRNPGNPNPTMAEYCYAFYVNDDQLGSNLRMPVSPNPSLSETIYNVQDNLAFVIIPLPGKVYLPAETAEIIAWNAMQRYANDWALHKARKSGKLGASEALGDTLVSDFSAKHVIARTYLTYGWKYKQRAIRNRLGNSVRQAIRKVDLPRFVYVTEFSTLQTNAPTDRYARRILAHAVVDATAKHQDVDSLLIFHAPGVLSWHAHEPDGTLDQKIAAVKDSQPYFAKERGSVDFAVHEAAGP